MSQTVDVTILSVTKMGDGDFVRFTYEITGAKYEWESKVPPNTLKPQDLVRGRYLPEDPKRAHILPLDDVTIAEAGAPLRGLGWLLVATALFLTPIALFPKRAGLVVGALFVAIMIGTNFAPEVRQLQSHLFGTSPLGLPVVWVVSLGELILIGPALLIFGPALFVLMQDALSRGLATSRTQVILHIPRGTHLTPELQSARLRALWSGLYLIALMGAWIAFAAYRGV